MRFLNDNFTISKRLLGIILFLVGIFGTVGLLLLDTIVASEDGGIGPAQKTAIIVMVALTILGLSLIPLGNDPA